jgi:hypothetical protein
MSFESLNQLSATTIGGGQRHTASAESRHASIQQALYPTEFVTTRSARPLRIRATDGKVDRDDQFAIANDHDQEDAINTGEHPVFLPTPPGANQAQLLTIFFEHRIIGDPGPLPAAARGRTRPGGVTPQRDQHLQTQAPEPLEPSALGQCTEQAGGEVLIPAPHAAQLGVGTAAKERRNHDTNDFAQELFLTLQTPFDLGCEVCRKPQGIEGLLESLSGVLRLAAVARAALLRCAITASSGFGVLFGVSCV